MTPAVGAVWYKRYHGRYTVVSVADGVATMRGEQGAAETLTVPLADFSGFDAPWFQPGPMSAPRRHVRTTADFMSESQRADMHSAGRGHLCR